MAMHFTVLHVYPPVTLNPRSSDSVKFGLKNHHDRSQSFGIPLQIEKDKLQKMHVQAEMWN